MLFGVRSLCEWYSLVMCYALLCALLSGFYVSMLACLCCFHLLGWLSALFVLPKVVLKLCTGGATLSCVYDGWVVGTCACSCCIGPLVSCAILNGYCVLYGGWWLCLVVWDDVAMLEVAVTV